MFVSLLQLMGFPATKPLHSRAEEKAGVRQGASQASEQQEQPARRATVKSIASKSKKAPVKATSSVKVVKTVKSVKPVKAAKSAKPVKPGKPVKVTRASQVVKSAKPVKTAKPAAPAKSIKVAAKASVKAPVKAPAKAPVKALAKTLPKTPVKTSPKVPVKAAPVKSPVKTQSKAVPAVPAKPISATISKKKPVPVTHVVEPKNTAIKSEKIVAAEAAANAAGVPVRSTRPSSRLAQLTVPSMAQAVASNAAKASFTQRPSPTPVLVPLASAVKKDPKLANNWKKKSVDQLSDEEVIAMSDHDYMNDVQMAFFRLKLVNLKNAILNSAGETTEHLREDTVVVPDPADRATIEEEHALELRTRDRERKLLKKIEQSIDRIDAGDYGYCDETGEPIGVARLLARPTATLSLEAQQRRELKQKMFGD